GPTIARDICYAESNGYSPCPLRLHLDRDNGLAKVEIPNLKQLSEKEDHSTHQTAEDEYDIREKWMRVSQLQKGEIKEDVQEGEDVATKSLSEVLPVE
ncbi:hypothetical protein HAX54_049539, partial [Datura stramonium]|nr:hypothetical protein [Datura stramonium]